MNQGLPPAQGLYDPQYEHDACGVGFVVHMKGQKSHSIVQQGLTILLNLDHRGAVGAEINTGDGAGILIQTPHKFLKKVAAAQGVALPEPGQFGVGNVYTSPDPAVRIQVREIFEQVAREEGQPVIAWRDIPTSNATLGETAKSAEPFMQQVFLQRGPGLVEQCTTIRLCVLRPADAGARCGQDSGRGVPPDVDRGVRLVSEHAARRDARGVRSLIGSART